MATDVMQQALELGRRLTDRPDWYGSEDAGFAGQLLMACAEEIRYLREYKRQTEEGSSGDAES